MLYLLHFDTPHHHAEHYLGSTNNLRRRLTQHATGRGAKLTAALHNQNEHWKLAALYIPKSHETRSRKQLERRAKRRHNSRAYCPICYPQTFQAPSGTIHYPTEEITFPTTSMEITECTNSQTTES